MDPKEPLPPPTPTDAIALLALCLANPGAHDLAPLHAGVVAHLKTVFPVPGEEN